MRCSRTLSFLVSAVATAWLVLPYPVHAQDAPPIATDIIIQHDVPMKTRDGVTLYADIYRPKSADKFPVILMRTPYDKSANWAVSPVFKMVPRGYVVIIQDVRGRYTSEGEWYPFRHEQADGYDTVEWAAALPYSDGKVGMIGASYVGATQMLAAIAQPPHLDSDRTQHDGQQLSRWLDLPERGLRAMVRSKLDLSARAEHAGAFDPSEIPTLASACLRFRIANYPVFNFGQLPADAQLTAMIAPYYLDWLAHPDYDDYWKQWSIEETFLKHCRSHAAGRRMV